MAALLRSRLDATQGLEYHRPMQYEDAQTLSQARPSHPDRRSDPAPEAPADARDSRGRLSLTADNVLSMQLSAGNHAVAALIQRRPGAPSGLSAAPGAGVMRGCDPAKQDTARAEAFKDETLFLRHGIGAHETNALNKGAGLYSGRGMSAIGLSDAAFAVGPITTDMGHFFYV
jgi:hypothetical protein